MPYTTPTAAEFKTRFPVFVSEGDDRIDAFLVEAQRSVDDSWLEDDYQPATMYLAAHLLLTENQAAGAAVGTSGVVKSESFGGEISKTYVTGSEEDALGLRGSVYGRRYLELLKKNHGGPFTI